MSFFYAKRLNYSLNNVICNQKLQIYFTFESFDILKRAGCIFHFQNEGRVLTLLHPSSSTAVGGNRHCKCILDEQGSKLLEMEISIVDTCNFNLQSKTDSNGC